ncbi:hypothetical protein IFM89_021192 [Coptis chinensis]|uniref:CASP-like protein n=1 Tax=Coptis chinensis TaxID=261450 RepID=A0A835HEK4_9MAGN|nr:hypothetical protein IFM89_021192 [Coptis chinensis]
MKSLSGGPGTVSGLLLRVGQILFSSASIGVTLSAFNSLGFSSFCWLLATMVLQLLWSSGLACFDVCALRIKRDIRDPGLVSFLVFGDWVIATLSLASACSSGAVTVLYATDWNVCSQVPICCIRLQVCVAMAFIAWFLTAISFLVTFWMLGSV